LEKKYYPVSIEKLQQASMREAAYLIAPVNIGEDYEYFDEVKHLLVIPEEPKTLEQISQELDEKFEKLLVETKRKFDISKQSAEYRFKQFCDDQDYKFEQAKKNGKFAETLTIGGSGSFLISNGSCPNWVTYNYIIKPDANYVGYYEISPNVQFWMKKKPNFIVRNCAKILLDLTWKDD
jgi:CRISPR/Cas system CSM-associated protein Csm5 (group 7 of RAMP superfamily)